MTVEAAIGIGSVLAVFLLVLAAIGVLLGQLRCTAAAVDAARLAARGDHDGARAAVARSAPPGAELVLTTEPGFVAAEVTAPSGAGLLPQRWRSSRAVAALEPEAGAPEVAGPGRQQDSTGVLPPDRPLEPPPPNSAPPGVGTTAGASDHAAGPDRTVPTPVPAA
ncbi:TadE family type IV pilus minor pilin [Saccharopolyspora sp. NPDC047091]|uniref:TadE family type IV pilus minor pilin n=1 Tax=Saccharopolyspora sp. NPDC047091 TaxID=3155924 RepID=UPI0033D3CF42